MIAILSPLLHNGENIYSKKSHSIDKASNGTETCFKVLAKGLTVSALMRACVVQHPLQNRAQDFRRNKFMKSKMAAGLLGIFLGAWGIHQFYLGDTKKGIIRIVVTLVTCGIGGIWGFIEGIMILMGKINTDAQGNPLAE